MLRCSRLLQEGWYHKRALAERLGVSERSVKRYLKALSEEVDGFETREVNERGQREYRIRSRRYVDRRQGTQYEVLALAMAQRFFKAFDPSGVADLLDQMIYEVTGEEDDADEDAIDRSRRSIARRFVLARAPQPMLGEERLVFDKILRALVERRVIDLRYQPRTGPVKDYIVRPYTLLLGEQELAVHGPIHEPPADGTARKGDQFRTFSLSRIHEIQLRKTRFTMPHLGLYDPEKQAADSWGLFLGDAEEVSLRVHPAFAQLLERRRWHPSQRSGDPDERGWPQLRFRVFPGGEFRTWLLGWGPWLEVESPASLKDWVDRMRSLRTGEGNPEEDEVFRIV
ncbi:MAG: WYL domain-containing protein [Myxococcota bacterium]|nr:WYL domain-containing protein [Myxococcota bacterium]